MRALVPILAAAAACGNTSSPEARTPPPRETITTVPPPQMAYTGQAPPGTGWTIRPRPVFSAALIAECRPPADADEAYALVQEAPARCLYVVVISNRGGPDNPRIAISTADSTLRWTGTRTVSKAGASLYDITDGPGVSVVNPGQLHVGRDGSASFTFGQAWGAQRTQQADGYLERSRQTPRKPNDAGE